MSDATDSQPNNCHHTNSRNAKDAVHGVYPNHKSDGNCCLDFPMYSIISHAQKINICTWTAKYVQESHRRNQTACWLLIGEQESWLGVSAVVSYVREGLALLLVATLSPDFVRRQKMRESRNGKAAMAKRLVLCNPVVRQTRLVIDAQMWALLCCRSVAF